MSNTTDWTARKDWFNGQIRPRHVKVAFFISLSFFVFWTGLSYFIFLENQGRIERAIQAFIDSGYREMREALFFPLMFLLSLIIIPSLVKTTRRYIRSKHLLLNLDPYPGQVGGRVGGDLVLPFAYEAGLQADVRVNCIEVTISRGSNKRTSRWEKVKYRTRAKVEFVPLSGKTMLRFTARTQPGLPESAIEESGSYSYWAVRIQVPDKDIDENFNIPVFNSKHANTDIFSRQDYFASGDGYTDSSDHELPGSVAKITYQGRDFNVDYPAGREGTLSTIFLLMGLIFSGVAFFMGYQITDELSSDRSSYFAIMVMSMILFGFSLFGIGMLIGGVYMKTNRLSVEKTNDKLITRRNVFGREFVTSLPLDDIYAIDKKVTSQSGQGASSKISYSLYAKTLDGLKHSIGDGIPGHENVDRLYDFFSSEIILSDKEPIISNKRKVDLPMWANYIPVIFKVLGYLVFIAVIGSFIMDFAF